MKSFQTRALSHRSTPPQTMGHFSPFSFLSFLTRGQGGGWRPSGCNCHWPGPGRGCACGGETHCGAGVHRPGNATRPPPPPRRNPCCRPTRRRGSDRPPSAHRLAAPRGPQEHDGGVGHRRSARPRPVAGAFVWSVWARLGARGLLGTVESFITHTCPLVGGGGH